MNAKVNFAVRKGQVWLDRDNGRDWQVTAFGVDPRQVLLSRIPIPGAPSYPTQHVGMWISAECLVRMTSRYRLTADPTALLLTKD